MRIDPSRFCIHRKTARADTIAKKLNEKGISAVSYHGDMAQIFRIWLLDQFLVRSFRRSSHGLRQSSSRRAQSEIPAFQVVVATNDTFGVGLDRAGVKLVLPLAPPPDLEAYYQARFSLPTGARVSLTSLGNACSQPADRRSLGP